jgi:phage regulator Rha-like protein
MRKLIEQNKKKVMNGQFVQGKIARLEDGIIKITSSTNAFDVDGVLMLGDFKDDPKERTDIFRKTMMEMAHDTDNVLKITSVDYAKLIGIKSHKHFLESYDKVRTNDTHIDDDYFEESTYKSKTGHKRHVIMTSKGVMLMNVKLTFSKPRKTGNDKFDMEQMEIYRANQLTRIIMQWTVLQRMQNAHLTLESMYSDGIRNTKKVLGALNDSLRDTIEVRIAKTDSDTGVDDMYNWILDLIDETLPFGGMEDNPIFANALVDFKIIAINALIRRLTFRKGYKKGGDFNDRFYPEDEFSIALVLRHKTKLVDTIRENINSEFHHAYRATYNKDNEMVKRGVEVINRLGARVTYTVEEICEIFGFKPNDMFVEVGLMLEHVRVNNPQTKTNGYFGPLNNPQTKTNGYLDVVKTTINTDENIITGNVDVATELLPDINEAIKMESYSVEGQTRKYKTYRCTSLGVLLIVTLGPKPNKNTGDGRTVLTRVIIEHLTHYEKLRRIKIEEKVVRMRDFGISSRQLLTNAISKYVVGDNSKYGIITKTIYNILGLRQTYYPDGYINPNGVDVGGKKVKLKRNKLDEETNGFLSVIEMGVAEMLGTMGKLDIKRIIYNEEDIFNDIRFNMNTWLSVKSQKILTIELQRLLEIEDRNEHEKPKK